MRFFYPFLIWLLLPIVLGYFLWRSLKEPAYRQGLGERLGYVPTTDKQPIWIHAASVGEADAAIILSRSIHQAVPDIQQWITVFTPTGADRIRSALGDAQGVTISYLPLDASLFVKRFLKRVRPRVGLIVERELWPTLYQACSEADLPLAVVSARWTEASVARYAGWFGKVLLQRSMDCLSLVAAQTEADAKSFIAAGVAEQRVCVVGNLKYDQYPGDQEHRQANAWRKSWGLLDQNVWLAASTHDGEEAIALRIHQSLLQKQPETTLIIAPRHPQRFERVAQLCEATGLRWFRLSEWSKPEQDQPVGQPQLILADTLGDLKALYALSDISFIAGSLVDVGGHNLFEALLFDVPIITGPHIQNWRHLADEMQAVGCLQCVSDESELRAEILRLLEDPLAREAMPKAGRALLARHRGAEQRTMAALRLALPGLLD